jgi:hypothetical protein
MMCQNCGAHIKFSTEPYYKLELCKRCYKKPIRELLPT